ncbi:MAG: NAD(P)/FAD-dependent oxidoreductase [Clostridia bacterium]|nr:NAD(P)/FAD-dependent oxidoreductase [Clostridia bacterium]
MFDVAIIGAGVVGGMIARKLSGYDLSICLVEKESDVAMGATKANSAIIHAGFDAVPGSLKAKLNVRGSVMMETVARELGVKYRRNGSMVLAFNDEEKVTLETLLERGEKNGVEGLRIIDSDELHQLEPRIADEVKYALLAPTGAIICPYELAIAAVGNAMDNGCELKTEFNVKSISDKGDHYLISDGKNEISARFVVNCAGVHSDDIAALVGDSSFTVTPRRGEYMLVDKEFGCVVDHTLFRVPSKMGKGILVSPTVDGNLLLGPTSEDIEDKSDVSTTASGLDTILTSVYETIKNPPSRSVITSFCGLRSTPDTGDFVINIPADRFVNAAGIESPGLSSSPAIAEYVAELLCDAGLVMEKKENYNPIREPSHKFREMSPEEKNRFIAENPAYGRYICRCEEVSEGEIISAIHTNPPARDLDAVKRRTRSGMGRCQGGFCSPSIVSILSRELGIPFEKVTKNGEGSIINFERTK